MLKTLINPGIRARGKQTLTIGIFGSSSSTKLEKKQNSNWIKTLSHEKNTHNFYEFCAKRSSWR